jgi:hypothetical protein
MAEAALNEDHNEPDAEELRDARFAELCRHPGTEEAKALVEPPPIEFRVVLPLAIVPSVT